MGGAIAEGNITPAAEFNIWADPEAARRVFESGIDVTMVGLDVTHKALLTPERADELRKAGRVGKLVAELFDFYHGFHRRTYGLPGSPVHDALALAHVVDPSLLELSHRHVAVDCQSELCRGRTVVDLWQQNRQRAERPRGGRRRRRRVRLTARRANRGARLEGWSPVGRAASA